MNFGQKFPYALLTFSQSLSKLIVGHTLSQKFVEVDCGPHLFHARTPLPKVVEAGYWVHYTSIITRTPSSTSTPIPHTPYHLYTNYTPTIHRLYTHPYLSSCELTATK